MLCHHSPSEHHSIVCLSLRDNTTAAVAVATVIKVNEVAVKNTSENEHMILGYWISTEIC